MKLFLSRIHYPITALGYGRRIGIWFQGCTIRCPGCISADTWELGRGETSVEKAWDAVSPNLESADGITISGGEPFDQPEALLELLKLIKTRLRGDVLLFSGYRWEELEAWTKQHPGLIDALVSDPFKNDVAQTLVLRGSDNQRITALTPLGAQRYDSLRHRERTHLDDAVDIFFEDGGDIWMVGIPRQSTLHRLEAAMHKEGLNCSTSQRNHFRP